MIVENQKFQLTRLLGKNVDDIRSLSGGCSYPVYALQCEGELLFLKTSATPTEVFRTEAHGLEQLRQWGANTPKVIKSDSQNLVLPFLDNENPKNEFWQNLARDLAELHKQKSGEFGFGEDNFIGASTQKNIASNVAKKNWGTFYWENRLLFKIQQLESEKSWRMIPNRKEALKQKCLSLLENHHCHPSPLHGDLWSGNILCGKNQIAYLIDPAFYFGDRETDIAMTECFGGFSPVFYRTYEEVFPLEEGYNQRKHLYNLYHMLNHFLIFGDQYLNSVENLINMILLTENK